LLNIAKGGINMKKKSENIRGNRSDNKHCMIIAEAGVNHNGKVTLAKKLIDSAKSAGADAIKFQLFQTENLVSRNTKKAPYQTRDKEFDQYHMLKNLELSYDEFESLKTYCDKKDIEFIATAYDLESAHFLNGLDVSRIKVASADIVNKPLIEAIARTKKQVLLAVGMATLGEIERTIKTIQLCQNSDIILLHCTTSYPTPYEQVNIKFMETLQRAFGLPVGYSDHTCGIEIPLMAVSLGATVIEKHFTLDRTMEGPDHFASIEPSELKSMVSSIRNLEKAFGDGMKVITDEEKKNIFHMRRSMHASQDLTNGDVLSIQNIKMIRPYDGIDPWFYDKISGKKIYRDILKDDPIRWSDLF
jgi:N,N'-diacetyllegionaminate synthase